MTEQRNRTGPASDDIDGVLIEVIAQFGRRIVDRPDRLRAALADTVGGARGDLDDEASMRARIDAVVTASRAGVASDIRDSDPGTSATEDEIRGWFDDLVRAGLSLRDAALATRTWATAFNASATAQMTASVSEGILSETDGAANDGGGGVQHAPASSEQVLGETEFGMTFDESRTIGVDQSLLAARPDPPVRAAEDSRVAPPTLEQLAELSPPQGRPARPRRDRGLGAGPQRPASPEGVPGPKATGRLVRRLGSPWIGAAAVAVIAATLAITVPMIVAEPPRAAAPRTLDESAPRIFTNSELSRFVLTEAQLRAFAPEATEVSAPAQLDYGEILPPDTTVGPETCLPVLWYSTGYLEGAGQVFGGYAWNGDNGSVTSYGRTYRSEEDAEEALRALVPAECTASLQVTSRGGITQTGRVQVSTPPEEEGSAFLATELTFDTRQESRACARDLNLVVCHSLLRASAYQGGAATSAQLLDELERAVAEHSPVMGDEQ
ncbi:hypothetical protein [Agromyces sp. NPDC049794]|uniref:hypothetical protein n=1 Tax=unclassified Agromyces TaxID=2639701 RepID=UPI0033FB9057